MSSGRFLVIRGGAIGDFILTLPVLSAIRASFPNSSLDLLAYPQVAELARAGGLVENYRHIESRAMASFFAAGGKLSLELADYFEQFDVIVSYLYDPDQVFKRNIERVSSAQFIQGLHRPEETQPEPASKTFLRALEILAVFDADPVPLLKIPGPPREKGKHLAIHPGSGSEAKNWPEAKWKFLLQQLAATSSCRLLVVGGEAEGDRLTRLSSVFPEERVEVLRSRPLVEVAQKLRAADFFIGHDSGISHLAGALGVKGLVLWGHTPELIWRPLSSNLEIIKSGGGILAIPVETVLEKTQSGLSD